MASLIFDLLTPEEAEDRKNVFDISLLSERLMMATQWLQFQSFYDGGAIAYFGAVLVLPRHWWLPQSSVRLFQEWFQEGAG